jgi:uncharacterized protein
MHNPNPVLRLFLLFGAPLLLLLLCTRPVLGNVLEAELNKNPKHPDHQFILATQYHQGQGVKKDLVLAIYWYEQAATQGHREAQFKVGHLLCEECTAMNEFQRGFDWLQKAAQQGQIHAQYEVGYMYLEGKQVKKDLQQAKHWLEMASKAGHVEAMRMLKFL